MANARAGAAALAMALSVSTGNAQAGEAERTIAREVIVRTSLERAWAAWTTNEGLRGFMSQHAHVTPELGGAFEVYFLPDNPPGLRGSEGCKVHSLVPQVLLQFTWNAPPQFAIRGAGLHTLVTLRFRERGPGEVIVSFVQSGWGVGPEWDLVYDYFSTAWDRVLGRFAAAYGGQVVPGGPHRSTPAGPPDRH